MRKERQRRAAAPKARLCGLCSFPRVTGDISETNYWNTSSIPIFVRWKKRMSLSYPNSIFLPGFCLSLLKFHSVSWLVENPIYIGFAHCRTSYEKIVCPPEWRNAPEIKRYMNHKCDAVSALFLCFILLPAAGFVRWWK